MNIGIITFHRAYNYGAFLQAFALCQRLNQEKNFHAEIVDFRMKKEVERYKVRWSFRRHLLNPQSYFFEKDIERVFTKAQDSNILVKSSEYMESDSIDDFREFVNGKYDILIAGSDEIWKLDSFRGFPNPYWLIGDLGAEKFSYAASSRSQFDKLHSKDLISLHSALQDFEFIGVRDQQTYDEVKKICGEEVTVHTCPDPTLVYDFHSYLATLKEEYRDVKKLYAKLDPSKKTILVMTEHAPTAEIIRNSLKEKYNLISVFVPHRGYVNCSSLSPFEWLIVIKNVDYVITSYFHATCFSIVFNKSFLAFGTKNKSAKVENLLKEMGLLDHFVLEDGNGDFTKDLIARFEMKKNNVEDYSILLSKQRSRFDVFLEEIKKYESKDKKEDIGE